MARRPQTPAVPTQSSGRAVVLKNKTSSICCLPLVNLHCFEVAVFNIVSSSLLILWRGTTSFCCSHQKPLPPSSLRTLWEAGGALPPRTPFSLTRPPKPPPGGRCPQRSMPSRTISQELLSSHISQPCLGMGKMESKFYNLSLFLSCKYYLISENTQVRLPQLQL